MAKVTIKAEPNSQNINITVQLKGSLKKVFRAYTERDLIAQWWGQGKPFDIDYYEPGTGGKWRYVQKSPDGEFAFRGSMHLVVPNEMCIQTFEWEGMPGHVAMDKAEFKSTGDKTTEVHITSTFQSVADRDGMISMGMEEGFTASTEALEKLIATL